MLIPLLLAHPEETPLSELIHPYDRYAIELALHDQGKRVSWQAILDCVTVGDLAGVCGEEAA